jgi:hypothetical protein
VHKFLFEKENHKMKRGRRSSAELTVVPFDATRSRPTLTPLFPLKSDEKKVFDLVVREHVHLKQIDAPLLMGYARAIAGLFKADTVEDFERLSRVSLSYATKLRISPQARVHPLSLARRQQQQPMSYYDRVAQEEPE